MSRAYNMYYELPGFMTRYFHGCETKAISQIATDPATASGWSAKSKLYDSPGYCSKTVLDLRRLERQSLRQRERETVLQCNASFGSRYPRFKPPKLIDSH